MVFYHANMPFYVCPRGSTLIWTSMNEISDANMPFRIAKMSEMGGQHFQKMSKIQIYLKCPGGTLFGTKITKAKDFYLYDYGCHPVIFYLLHFDIYFKTSTTRSNKLRLKAFLRIIEGPCSTLCTHTW